MKLQTQIPNYKQTICPITYNSKLLLLGSCFSENIGDKLNYFQFQNIQNPFGILFHPKAIERFIAYAINKKEYSENGIFFNNERWHSFDAHSNLSNTDKTELLKNLNSAIALTNKKLIEASHIIITLGTSWVYRFIEEDRIVANCHKVPQKKFLKELLSVEEVSESIEAIISLLKSVNENLNIIFTVSPVRHLKDGFIENTLSKSHLISGIHDIIDSRKNTYYFPSYEIMMDELRDYRFYAEDLIHPNKTAINYIWEKFLENWFSEETLPVLKKVDSIRKGISHRPFNQSSKQHHQFLKDLESKKTILQKEFPFMNF